MKYICILVKIIKSDNGMTICITRKDHEDRSSSMYSRELQFSFNRPSDSRYSIGDLSDVECSSIVYSPIDRSQ